MGDIKRVLVIKLGALGDILLAEGALRDIRAHHAGAHIAVLTRWPFSALLARCPWVDEVLADDHHPRWRLDAMWRLRNTLRAGRFDIAYDLQNSRRSKFYLRNLLGHRDGLALQTPLSAKQQVSKSLPVLQRHLVQLTNAGITATHVTEPRADWMRTSVETLLEDAGITTPFVVLLPGSSSRGAAKRWPHYAELAARLHARGLLPVTVPGPEELGVFSGFPGVELRAADGRALSLYALAGVLGHATAVVGNDSGPTHLAANLNVPGLALFGSTPAQATRTGIGRGSIRVLVSPAFDGLDAAVVESALLDVLNP